MNKIGKAFSLFLLLSASSAIATQAELQLHVLGIAQDAGYPQLNCYQPHCMQGWQNPETRKLATSLAIVDSVNKQKYLFEATPDIKQQMYQLHLLAPDLEYKLGGIFLTHAHIGHYAGLIHLGREAASTENVAVFAMPKMANFLATNGPWSQLVKLGNITLRSLADGQSQMLSANLSVKPLQVPHRDEFSETVGFSIKGPTKSVLFVPDIDKWHKWSTSIVDQIKSHDYALLDATFFSNGELPNRDMSQVPHPFVEESMRLFKSLSPADKRKVIFIHFNHSNPLLNAESDAAKAVEQAGFQIAKEGMVLSL